MEPAVSPVRDTGWNHMHLSMHLSWDGSTSLFIPSSPCPCFLHCFLIPLTGCEHFWVFCVLEHIPTLPSHLEPCDPFLPDPHKSHSQL